MGINAFYLNKHKGFDLRIIPKLYSIFKRYKPDVVHTHLPVLHYTLIPSFLSGIKVKVHTIHSIAQKDAGVLAKIIQWIAFRFGKVVPVSISVMVANTVKKIYGRSIYTPVIFNGIPIDKFSKSIKLQNDVVKMKLTLINVARFVPQKNHLLLLESFSHAIKIYPYMELWLVGDGPLRKNVENAILEKNLQDKVFTLGIRYDITNLLEKADIFIMSSNYEGLPLSLLEAMAAGKAIIATSVGGIPEVIEDGVTGILVPPNNAEAMTKAILRLAMDREFLKKLGKAAEMQVKERFDISRTAKEYESLYVRLLQKDSKMQNLNSLMHHQNENNR
jgi:glycosyltransferase involved in cell wall biosynthesis